MYWIYSYGILKGGGCVRGGSKSLRFTSLWFKENIFYLFVFRTRQFFFCNFQCCSCLLGVFSNAEIWWWISKKIQVLLMEEILHQLGCKEPVNNGINYLSTCAGFLPSTVSHMDRSHDISLPFRKLLFFWLKCHSEISRFPFAFPKSSWISFRPCHCSWPQKRSWKIWPFCIDLPRSQHVWLSFAAMFVARPGTHEEIYPPWNQRLLRPWKIGPKPKKETIIFQPSFVQVPTCC